MGKFYTDELKTLHTEVDAAVLCPSTETLKDKVQTISKTLSSLNLECQSYWPDEVGKNFDDYISSCTDTLDKIVISIESDFLKAEETYKKLKPWLDDLKEKDSKYEELLANEPTKFEVKHVYKNEAEAKLYVETSKHKQWTYYVNNVESYCTDLKAQIEETKKILPKINKVSVVSELINMSGTGSTNIPAFELPEGMTQEDLDYPQTSSAVERYLNRVTGETIELPEGLGNVHTYMGWQKVTNKASTQYKLRETAGMNFDNEGFAKVGDRYVVATTTTFGNVGDYIDIYQDDGTVIKAIIGDIKSQEVVAWDKNPANKWGHQNGNCVVEFVVDCNSWYTPSWKSGAHVNPGTDECHPEWNQNINKIVNKGNYFNTVEV